MTRRTFKTVVMPDGFDIKKYDECANFQAQEWYSNLLMRTIRFTAIRDHEGYYGEELRNNHAKWFEAPIHSSMKITEGDGYSKSINRRQVNDATAYDVLTTHLSLPSDEQNPYRKAVRAVQQDIEENNCDNEVLFRAFEFLEVPAWKMDLDMGWDHSGEVRATVDLYASEEKLIEDFRSWLRETRTKLNVPQLKRRFNATDFADWHHFRVLAYLDLTAWAHLLKIPMTHQQLGIALFPDEYGVNLADRVRKVVSPRALPLVTPATMDALYGQALEDQLKTSNDNRPENSGVTD
jgi:hypothetical protein